MFTVRPHNSSTVSSSFTQRLQHFNFFEGKKWNLFLLVGFIIFFSISLFDFTWMLLLLETKGVSLGSDEAASSGASCSASSAPKWWERASSGGAFVSPPFPETKHRQQIQSKCLFLDGLQFSKANRALSGYSTATQCRNQTPHFCSGCL